MNTTPLQVRNAYRAGWNASAKVDGPSLDSAEDTYVRRGRTDAQHDAWLAGWLDYAADNAYGTALDETPAPAVVHGARGGCNYFVTAPSAIAYELRHVQQISRDWRQGMTEFATIGQHGSGYWTVTQGHTASGAPMELTDEPMTLTCVTRFADSRQAQAAVRANGYR